jgi:hypothetical protein
LTGPFIERWRCSRAGEFLEALHSGLAFVSVAKFTEFRTAVPATAEQSLRSPRNLVRMSGFHPTEPILGGPVRVGFAANLVIRRAGI